MAAILYEIGVFPVKSILSLAVLTALLTIASCGSESTASGDVAARVNGKEITTAELEKEFQIRTSTDQPPSVEEAQDLKLQLLNQMINDRILLELAAQAGLTATDAEVDVKFNELKNQGTEEQFQEMLKQQKMSVDDVKAEYRKQITIDKLVNKEITSKISVSEGEIKSFYDKNKDSFNLPEGFHIAHILIDPAPTPDLNNAKNDDAKTPDEARQKALRVLHDIQTGQDFATEARNYSEDPGTAPLGGDLNFQPIDNIANTDPALAAAVKRLKVGETSGVIETRFGYHIVKLLERDPGGQKDLSDPRIQAQVRQVIFNRKDTLYKNAFSENARNNAKINNYLAQRILENAGKEQQPAAAPAPATESKQ
jgi:peptidyl-prolyl cis-trans isomerase SurA